MRALFCVACMIALAPAIARAQSGVAAVPAEALEEKVGETLSLSVTAGALYSSGDYGAQQETNILVVPFNLRARTGPLRFSAVLPYLRIDSPGIVVGGGDLGPIIIDPNTP